MRIFLKKDQNVEWKRASSAIQWEKNSLFNKWLGQMDSHIQKNEFGLVPYTIYKNQLKMDLNAKA